MQIQDLDDKLLHCFLFVIGMAFTSVLKQAGDFFGKLIVARMKRRRHKKISERG